MARFVFRPARKPKRRRSVVALFSKAASGQSIAGDSAIGSWTVAAVTVIATVSIAAGSASSSWVVPAPTVTSNVTVSAGTASASWTVPAPTVTSPVAVAADSATASWVVPAASILGNQTVSADSATAAWVVPTATVAPPEESAVIGGGFRRSRFSYQPEDYAPDVLCTVDLVLAPVEFSAELRVVPADMQIRTRLLLTLSPSVSADVTMRPADMRLQTLLDLKAIAMMAQLKADQKDS